jgi:molybdate transport system substrate-binding protein
MTKLLLAFLIALSSIAQADAPPPLSIAAAADLKFVMDQLTRSFKDAHPESEARATFGASGSLAAQIENGAPFDVFLAADSTYTAALIKKGVVTEDHAFEYGLGRLALWVNPAEAQGIDTLQKLTDPKIRKIAVANPDHAPYGKAAIAALKAAGVYDSIKSKLVFGENVSQAAQYVQIGAAQAGLVSLSLLKGQKSGIEGAFHEIPSALAPPLRQSGVILKRSKQLERARAFEKFILSETGRKILLSYGIEPPERKR